MEDKTINLLMELSNLHAGPSDEGAVRNYLKNKLDPFADDMLYDKLGGLYAVKNSKVADAPTLMMAAHMDEVAFMVTGITSGGMLVIKKLGGHWENAILSQRVCVHATKETLTGVILPGNSKPDAAAPVSISDTVVDIGAGSREEVESWGVTPGVLATYATKAVLMKDGKKLLGKAWDDRVGCAMAVSVMESLQHDDIACRLVCGGSVQEEVGRRGAAAGANLVKPDFFLALEGPPANDIGGSPDAFGRLGHGVLIRIADREVLLSPEIREFFLDIAAQQKIPYQFYVSQGGTDAGLVQTTGIGVPSTVIGVPVRGAHSAESIMHVDDYDAAVEFLIHFARAFDSSSLQTLLPR